MSHTHLSLSGREKMKSKKNKGHSSTVVVLVGKSWRDNRQYIYRKIFEIWFFINDIKNYKQCNWGNIEVYFLIPGVLVSFKSETVKKGSSVLALVKGIQVKQTSPCKWSRPQWESNDVTRGIQMFVSSLHTEFLMMLNFCEASKIKGVFVMLVY